MLKVKMSDMSYNIQASVNYVGTGCRVKDVQMSSNNSCSDF